jgi:hypothetical protein
MVGTCQVMGSKILRINISRGNEGFYGESKILSKRPGLGYQPIKSQEHAAQQSDQRPDGASVKMRVDEIPGDRAADNWRKELGPDGGIAPQVRLSR